MEPRRFVLDLEAQRDFFDPDGACYRPDSLAVARAIGRLFDWIRAEGISVISTVLRLPSGELGPMSCHYHCITGTVGEQKLPRTVLDSRINFGIRNVTDLPGSVLADYQQVIFEKRHTDIFKHARLERLLTERQPATVILCGAGVGQGIVEAAIGLRSRRVHVIAASDAILDLDAPNQYMPVERMRAKGVLFVPVDDIIAAPAHHPLHPAHARHVNHGAA